MIPIFSDSSSRRVAVTGAGGFIGLHLLRGLQESGAEIVAILAIGKSTEGLDALPFRVERVFVEDPSKMGDAITQTAPRYVIHLSAYVSTERSVRSLQQTMQWNLLSTISVLTACAEIHVERVILMGSCEEYGQNISPFDPLVAPDPPSPYAASKAAATCYARMFYSSFQLPTVVLRPSVVYGPGQSPRMLIPQVMAALAKGESVDVTEGRQTRDFVYVQDVVDAILHGLTAPNIEGDVWNVGSGEIITVKDCLLLIEQVTHLSGLIKYGARPYNNREIFHYHPRVEETYTALNWKPAISLHEGLRRTWQSLLNKA